MYQVIAVFTVFPVTLQHAVELTVGGRCLPIELLHIKLDALSLCGKLLVLKEALGHHLVATVPILPLLSQLTQLRHCLQVAIRVTQTPLRHIQLELCLIW